MGKLRHFLVNSAFLKPFHFSQYLKIILTLISRSVPGFFTRVLTPVINFLSNKKASRGENDFLANVPSTSSGERDGGYVDAERISNRLHSETVDSASCRHLKEKAGSIQISIRFYKCYFTFQLHF